MNQKTVIWLSLVLSVIGISFLFFLSPEVSPQFLLMDGVVTRVDHEGKVTFISFVPDNLDVVSFKDLRIPVGNVSLFGRLSEYKGRVEFVVEGVR